MKKITVFFLLLCCTIRSIETAEEKKQTYDQDNNNSANEIDTVHEAAMTLTQMPQYANNEQSRNQKVKTITMQSSTKYSKNKR